MPESGDELRHDSRWPAFFPSAIGFATTHDGADVALERVVGAQIVNRFPFVMALSLCREELSDRHHSRRRFMNRLERSGNAAVQFFTPSSALDRILAACRDVPEGKAESRLAYSGLATRNALMHGAPVFDDAYLVYEGQLASATRDQCGERIYEQPWVDVGSHRVYFVEIRAIQLHRDIAKGRNPVRWQCLPDWHPRRKPHRIPDSEGPQLERHRFLKPFTPYYQFPSSQTAAFEADEQHGSMAVKYMPPDAANQVERDNDRARWPCFFPCSVGMISVWGSDGIANLMPCGSTSIVSRHPLVIAPCVSYAAINERYAPRASLELIRHRGWFGCGVPFVQDRILGAIRYAGNTSIREDRDKLRHCGLEVRSGSMWPNLPDLPIQFGCKVVGEVRLGTHAMFLGEVREIRTNSDVSPANPMLWRPWASVSPRIEATPTAVARV